MSQKRQTEDANSPDDKRRRIPSFQSVVHRVVWTETVRNLLEPILEPLIRKVVKEEVDLALKKYMISVQRNCEKEMHAPAIRNLRLQFLSTLSLPVFTGARIEGEELFPVKIALLDASTGQIVSSGPESSAKVEIVVLEGDFDADDAENWTVEDFRNNIVREREGKKSLLTGEVVFNLVDGACSLADIAFTDNSSWTRSRRFRLGARVIDTFEGVIVKEAKTESIVVRDHRGELYKKHYPPYLHDEVWRLEKIGKDGAFHKRLSREGVKTVKDFLTLFYINPSSLRNILGTGMSAKMWEVTVDHARSCVINNNVYLYYPPGSPLKDGVIFNIVGQVMGLLSESQHVPSDKLSETEKVDAQNLVISAFQHWENVVSFDREASLGAGSSNLSNHSSMSRSPRTEPIDGFDYTQSIASSADIISSMYPTGELGGLEDYTLHGLDNLGLEYEQTVNIPSQATNALICDMRPMNEDFFDEDHLQFFSPNYALQSQALEFGSTSDAQSSNDGWRCSAVAHMRWTKVFSVFKWFWLRKEVKKKRNCFLEFPRFSNTS
ncbi:hypothetical protein MLD38_012543 [Melastoma candidum]|uniref:Uncharacterized protein n=1 Tax=Melastoma candidum TaxID=119954 RepID=A0ACB9R691_9MYRT|nr:hypothetical protein MLD38_012543 [Melastoma candidum]